MKLFRTMTILLALCVGALAMTGCDEQGAGEAEGEHATVESGTHEGTIKKVNPDESEIYVDSDGQELELYFTEETELTRDGEAVEFPELEEGQSVEVEIEKVGQRLDPLSVKILE